MDPRTTSAIAKVTPATLAMFDAALQHLSSHLGDEHRSDADMLEAALFGPQPFAMGLLAEDGGGHATGALLATPMLSTTRGGPGLYISDLWVAEAARGSGLGRRLLAAALRETPWGAPHFMKLAVYDGSAQARAVYDRLGFAPQAGETGMTLAGAPLDNLKGLT